MTRPYYTRKLRRTQPLLLSPSNIGTDSTPYARVSHTVIVADTDDNTTSPNVDEFPPFAGCTEGKRRRPVELPSPDSSRTPSPTMVCSSPSQEYDMSISPAAVFLSSFSAPQSPTRLPDTDGAVVGGYTLGPIIGYGGFSIIRRGFSNSGGTVAVKIVHHADLAKQGNPTLARKRLDRESEVWATLSHEHILPLFSVVNTSYADYFFTLYCPAGTLFDILKRDGRPALPQEEVGMMFRQVVRGLRYLHEVAGMVHRDIKLENVLVDEMGICRIGDFGMATRIGELDDDNPPEQQEQPKVIERKSRTGLLSPLRLDNFRHRNSAPPSSITPPSIAPGIFQPGSLPYAAPEVFLPQTPSTRRLPHPAQDIWALGVLLYVLLTGKLPFTDAFEPRLQMKILLGDYVIPTGIGRGAERVLQGCLERSVTDRWTIDMVDDVAWSIGWGEEGDDVSSPTSDMKERQQFATKPTSPLWNSLPRTSEHDHDFLVSSFESQQAHPSLPKRQLSPPPTLSGRSSSARCASPGPSRPPSHPASLSTTVHPSHPTVEVPSEKPLHPLLDSAASISPSSSPPRGRRTREFSTPSASRSPSLGALPRTPTDRYESPIIAIRRSLERGRRLASERSHDHLFGSEGLKIDSADESASGKRMSTHLVTTLRSPSASRSSRLDSRIPPMWTRSASHNRRGRERIGKRTESAPAARSSAWPTMKFAAGEMPEDINSNRPFTQPVAISNPRQNGTRSLSVGSRHLGDVIFHCEI